MKQTAQPNRKELKTMNAKEFKNAMQIYGDTFYSNTCCKLQFEIIKKIINAKNLDEFTKLTLINQYTKDLSTNDIIIEAIKQYNRAY